MSGPFELVLFDCDGVLVDSERIANEVFARILHEEYGLILTLEQMYDRFLGRSFDQCLATIEDMIGKPPSASIRDRYRTEARHAMAARLTAVKGVERVLKDLRIPYCVASNGSHETMRLTLGKTKLLPLVEGRLYSAADVERGKPHPDVYQYAARRMDATDPAKCLVIEDSPWGVQAGIAANMTVFGYCERTPAATLTAAGAAYTFDAMDQLLDFIETH